MAWRLAKTLEKLRSQVNAEHSNRSKESDGSIGDLRHQHEATSDHNPWVKDGSMGVVTAIDITHDPKNGFNSYDFADMLLARQDPRLKYVISNRRIGSGPAGPQPGKWRKYSGSNPHDHHVHISVVTNKTKYDDERAWDIQGVKHTVPVNVKPVLPTLKSGSRGEDVKALQRKLGVTADGIFGEATRLAVAILQNKRGLIADGIVGPQTWKIINE